MAIVGDRYEETKGLPLRDILAFIKRDIYLAVKRGCLPAFEYSVAVNPEPIAVGIEGGHIGVVFGQCAPGDDLEIEFGIANILTAYNLEKFSLRLGRLEPEGRRFGYSVKFQKDCFEETVPPPIPAPNGEAA